jgi:hypothetical protein
MADITATYESVSLGDYVGDESRKDLTSWISVSINSEVQTDAPYDESGHWRIIHGRAGMLTTIRLTCVKKSLTSFLASAGYLITLANSLEAKRQGTLTITDGTTPLSWTNASFRHLDPQKLTEQGLFFSIEFEAGKGTTA